LGLPLEWLVGPTFQEQSENLQQYTAAISQRFGDGQQ